MGQVTVPDLIEHARRYMNDYTLSRDWHDCVMVLAEEESEAHRALAEYYRLRRSSRHFSPGRAGPNNHSEIPNAKLAGLLGHARTCEECGTPFESKSKRSAYCGQRCRKRASRGQVSEAA